MPMRSLNRWLYCPLPLVAAVLALLLPLEASALTRQEPDSGSFFASEWETCRNYPIG